MRGFETKGRKSRGRGSWGALVPLALACVAVTLGGCGSSGKRYPLRGRVMAKSAATDQLTVNHDDIPGFMPAMTMLYPVVDSKGLDAVQPGDVITANVVVQSNGNYWLERVTIADSSGRGSFSATAPHELLPGETVPDVPLVNQDGKTIHLGQYRGQAVLITFIYTRCPFPTFCPLISSEFAAIHKEMKMDPTDLRGTHMVSISLDPAYDTAPVLRKYGLAYLSDDAGGFAHWEFVSTTPADLEKLAAAFGLQYSVQDNQITHSMSTVLLARDGTVAKSWPGNEWKTEDVAAALRQFSRTRNRWGAGLRHGDTRCRGWRGSRGLR